MRRTALSVVLLFVPACDEGDGNEGGGGSVPVCETEDRAMEYLPGLEVMGDAGVSVTLIGSVPAPPQKGDNRWTIAVSDMAGQPLDDLDLAVIPIMPDHGHGTPVTTLVEPGEAPGEYVLDPVNLMMAGYWETTVEIEQDGEPMDAVMFPFCVES